MSDVYSPEVNPDNEPGELLDEGLQGADVQNEDQEDDADDVDDADPDL